MQKYKKYYTQGKLIICITFVKYVFFESSALSNICI